MHALCQAFVPRWREKLYLPLAQCLEERAQV